MAPAALRIKSRPLSMAVRVLVSWSLPSFQPSSVTFLHCESQPPVSKEATALPCYL